MSDTVYQGTTRGSPHVLRGRFQTSRQLIRSGCADLPQRSGSTCCMSRAQHQKAISLLRGCGTLESSLCFESHNFQLADKCGGG
eukprot:6687985-Alexandrium_andersonii.AAC.1